MKSLLLLAAVATAGSPVQKVLELLDSLERKIIAEGEGEQTTFEQLSNWCENTAAEKGFEMKTAKSEIESAAAAAEKAASIISAMAAKVQELSASIHDAEGEKANATTLRAAEHGDYLKIAAELEEAVSALHRATSVLSKHLGGGARSLAQLDEASFSKVTAAFSQVISAAAVQTADKRKIVALLQGAGSADDLVLTQGVVQPKAAAYESHSGGILDVMADLLSKAEAELEDAQESEMKSQHAFELVEQALSNQLKGDNKALAKAKKTSPAAAETEAVATGDKKAAEKELADAKKTLRDTHTDCMDRARDFETNVAARKEELAALNKAEEIIRDTTDGADKRSYSSFLQLGSKRQVRQTVRALVSLSRQYTELAQLASRAQTESSASAGPFDKVKGLILNMISKLETEAEADAEEYAYCTKETADSTASRDDKQTSVDDLTANIDSASSAAAKLRNEVNQLQSQLTALAKSQREMDSIRREEKANFEKADAELSQGLEGIRMALQVLRDYYSSKDESTEATALVQYTPHGGASTGIIGMLEVAESDFAKGLAEARSAEDSSAAEHAKITQENKVTKATKTADVKHKTAERKSLEKAVADFSSDRDSVQEELDAVLEYLSKLRERCVKKPLTYEQRAAKRKKEIDGLKDALTILENESSASFLQTKLFLRA